MSRNTFEAKGGLTLRDPTLQIKAWQNNNKTQMDFWERTMLSRILCGFQDKTQDEARELHIYFKGRYDLALAFEQFFKE